MFIGEAWSMAGLAPQFKSANINVQLDVYLDFCSNLFCLMVFVPARIDLAEPEIKASIFSSLPPALLRHISPSYSNPLPLLKQRSLLFNEII